MDEISSLIEKWTGWWSGRWQIMRREYLDAPGQQVWAIFRESTDGIWSCRYLRVSPEEVAAGRHVRRFEHTMGAILNTEDGYREDNTGPTMVVDTRGWELEDA